MIADDKRTPEMKEGYAKCWKACFPIYPQVHELWCSARDMGCPGIYGGDIGYGERDKVRRVSASLDEWGSLVQKAKSLYHEMLGAREYIDQILSEINDISISLFNSYPAEYDQDMFGKAFVYQANLRGVKHWSIPVLSECEMQEYEAPYNKVKALFADLTEGLRTHNFSICHAMEGDYSTLSFTCEGVPGELEFEFPTIQEGAIVQEGLSKGAMCRHLPMQMAIAWRFHDVIPVIDRFFGETYHLKELKASLRQFVDSEGWRDMLHKKFVVGRDDEGQEITTEEVPDYYKKTVEDSIAKAAIEQRSSGKEG